MRSARAASARSCVTSTSVVPSRWLSEISKIEHQRPVDAIQIPGGFVGHQDRRLAHEGARQRHALLLASGKLHRIVIHTVFETDALEQLARASRVRPRRLRRRVRTAAARSLPRSASGSIDRTEIRTRSSCPRTTASSSSFSPVMSTPSMTTLPDVARIESGQQSQQSAFAAARGSHDGDELPGGQFQIHAAQDLDAMRAGVDGFGKRDGFEDRHALLFYYDGNRCGIRSFSLCS